MTAAAIDARTWDAAVADGRRLLAAKARTFALAARLFPPAVRDDVAVLYGFCRLADDLADLDGDRDGLVRLEAELLGTPPARPVVAALRHVAARRGFALAHARTLLHGVRSDLEPMRIATEDDLLRYSYRVASTVGLMLSRIVGVRDAAADVPAVALGVAMQLTNIVRDVAEDAERGRVYLPDAVLAAHGTDREALLARRAPREAVRAASLDVLALADCCYRVAEHGFGAIPFRARCAIAVAARTYGAIGWRIRRTDHHPLDGRMVVPPAEKAMRLAEGVLAAARAPSPPSRRPVPVTAPLLDAERHVVGHRA